MKTSIVITTGLDTNSDKEIQLWLDRYDLPEIVSEKLNLSWKTKTLNLKHSKGNSDWESNDTVLADFKRGIWCISGIAHELVHLILRQNNWIDLSAKLKIFTEQHPELSSTNRGAGYLIEQMIAYLVQADVDREIGQKENKPEMIDAWNIQRFHKIINSEYRSDFSKQMAKKMIDKWDDKKGMNIVLWIEDIIFD